MNRWWLPVFLLALLLVDIDSSDADSPEKADRIFHNARVVTVDGKFSVAEAMAVGNGRILAVGKTEEVMRSKRAETQVVDLQGRMVLPGLYDSHVHPIGAATSETVEPIPDLGSLEDAFAYIRKKAREIPKGNWIVLRFAFPTRLKEARFPTREELDRAAPENPVLYHAGPAGMVNTMALKVSGITRDTPNPRSGVIVRDPKTGEPTGMIRNAYGALKGVPSAGSARPDQRREAVRKLFAIYNALGITSIADRNGSRSGLDLYLELEKAGELTVRINVSRGVSPYGTREEIARRLDALPGKDGKGGPTGRGGIWIRIGPIKFFLDGGMLNGTAYMRTPWPPGPTYQIVEKNYRGLLFPTREEVKTLVEEAARRGWQVTAHTAGEGAMDVLLDAYELADRIEPIKNRRFCITHANFPSRNNLERCRRLGVVADVQPAWLYKDGPTLAKVLGEKRIRWFQPFKSWLKYTTIGGGSDHMLKLDPRRSVNPFDPWLGMYVALTRKTEKGIVLNPEECLNREEALRLYTIHNAYINGEEKEKGSLEPGKLADWIVLDRDYLTCPVEEVKDIRVLETWVGGRRVYLRKE